MLGSQNSPLDSVPLRRIGWTIQLSRPEFQPWTLAVSKHSSCHQVPFSMGLHALIFVAPNFLDLLYHVSQAGIAVFSCSGESRVKLSCSVAGETQGSISSFEGPLQIQNLIFAYICFQNNLFTKQSLFY